MSNGEIPPQSLAAKWGDALQRFDRRVWPAHRVELGPKLIELLGQTKLVVADVGAASGPEELWRAIAPLIHFLTFEPLPRPDPANAAAGSRTNFPIGLSSRKGSGVLTVMRDPDASTLCRANHQVLSPFPIGDGLQPVRTMEIDLDTLDHCLEGTPALRPDFIKVDVEGADLDVLRGAATTLEHSVLGVRVEVSFVERHQGAPFFGETDAYLRRQGLQLLQVSRERWIRRNLVYGYSSEAQLAWGDAVYFLTAENFLRRLRDRDGMARTACHAKMILLLLAHGAHDYALELIELALAEKLISREWGEETRAAVMRSVDRSPGFVLKSLAGVLFASGIYALAFPLKSARQRARFYVRQRLGHFARTLLRMAGRSGPLNSCISD